MSRKQSNETSKRRSRRNKTNKQELYNQINANLNNVADRQPLHDRFKDYTAQELAEIKMNNCIAHKCPYLSKVHWSQKHGGGGAAFHSMCNYIIITEHSRDCMPDVCEHWKDTNINTKNVAPNLKNLFIK